MRSTWSKILWFEHGWKHLEESSSHQIIQQSTCHLFVHLLHIISLNQQSFMAKSNHFNATGIDFFPPTRSVLV